MDDFVRDRSEWEMWNRWRRGNDRFSRKYIFSLIDFFPETHIWLFGGIYEVISRSPVNYSHSYHVALDETSAEFIGRLKIHFRRNWRAQSVNLENYYSDMVVSEILPEPYSGERFCGYDNICHDFDALEIVFGSDKLDWKTALENAKGVYLIVDKQNGKKYVGSAYGNLGIWARWQSYIDTGHGGNDDLKKIVREKGIEYAKDNFQISLLEYLPFRTDDDVIFERELLEEGVAVSQIWLQPELKFSR